MASSNAASSKVPLEGLEVGAEYVGEIYSVKSYGAFVDIGATTNGLLHISEISHEFIDDVGKWLSVGQSVTVRIKGVDLQRQRFELTSKEPDEVYRARREAEEDEEYLTLASMLQALVGSVITVEYADSAIATGQLEQCDLHMK